MEGNVLSWDFCGPDCPMDANAWKNDETLKVTYHNLDQNELKIIAPKLLGIMACSLILISVTVTGLGISGFKIS